MSSDPEVTMPQFLPDPTALSLNALPSSFACTWGSEGVDGGWVHVAGDLDLAAAPRLVEVLRDLEQQVCLIVLDLREIAFLNTAGVHAIVDASIGARRDGRRLLLVAASARVQRVFALTGTSHQVEVGAWDDPSQLPVQAFLPSARRSIAA
jgi:anti-sigma B factor antagonist